MEIYLYSPGIRTGSAMWSLPLVGSILLRAGQLDSRGWDCFRALGAWWWQLGRRRSGSV